VITVFGMAQASVNEYSLFQEKIRAKEDANKEKLLLSTGEHYENTISGRAEC
jgi:hypothetical protein